MTLGIVKLMVVLIVLMTKQKIAIALYYIYNENFSSKKDIF